MAVVAALSEREARKALNLIKVTYRPLEPVMTPWEALEEGAPRVHEDRENLFFQQPIIFGGAEKGRMEADVAVEAGTVTEGVDFVLETQPAP